MRPANIVTLRAADERSARRTRVGAPRFPRDRVPNFPAGAEAYVTRALLRKPGRSDARG